MTLGKTEFMSLRSTQEVCPAVSGMAPGCGAGGKRDGVGYLVRMPVMPPLIRVAMLRRMRGMAAPPGLTR